MIRFFKNNYYNFILQYGINITLLLLLPCEQNSFFTVQDMLQDGYGRGVRMRGDECSLLILSKADHSIERVINKKMYD